MKRLCIVAIILACAVAALSAPAQEQPYALYLKGAKLFRQGQYDKAKEAFKQIILHHPDTRFAPDAVFKTGEIYYRLHDYEKAGGYFKLYMERYALGRNAGDAKIRLAQCEAVAGRRIHAAHPRMAKIDKPLRAVRVDRFFQPSWKNLDSDLAILKSQGANALIVPAFHPGAGAPHAFIRPSNPPGAYFHTESAPVCEDMLPRLASLAHKYRLRVVARLPVRSIPVGPRDVDWDPADKKQLKSKKMDLFAPRSIQAAQQIVRDLSEVTIDGLLLCDLQLSPVEGFGPKAMEAYEQRLGKTPDFDALFFSSGKTALGALEYKPAPEYSPLAEAKAAQVTKVARLLAKAARDVNPNIDVWVEISPDAAEDPARGLLWESLEVEHLANAPFSGVFFEVDLRPLSQPGALTGNDRSGYITQLCQSAAASAGDPSRLILAFRIINPMTKKPLPDWRIAEAVKTGASIGKIGVAVRPLSIGLDYRKVFVEPFQESPSEDKGDMK